MVSTTSAFPPQMVEMTRALLVSHSIYLQRTNPKHRLTTEEAETYLNVCDYVLLSLVTSFLLFSHLLTLLPSIVCPCSAQVLGSAGYSPLASLPAGERTTADSGACHDPAARTVTGIVHLAVVKLMILAP